MMCQFEYLICCGEFNVLRSFCRYRMGNYACAIGCLMTDSEANAADQHEFSGLFTQDFIERYGLNRLAPHYEMLRQLQVIHDSHPPYAWKDSLMRLTVRLNLSDESLS